MPISNFLNISEAVKMAESMMPATVNVPPTMAHTWRIAAGASAQEGIGGVRRVSEEIATVRQGHRRYQRRMDYKKQRRTENGVRDTIASACDTAYEQTNR